MKAKIGISWLITVLLAALMFSGCVSQEARSSEQEGMQHYTLTTDAAAEEGDYEQAKAVLEKRLDEMGYEDYSISADSSGITLDIAEENTEILSELCKKGELYFREGTEADGEIILDGNDIESAYALYDEINNGYNVGLTFTESGSQLFYEATGRLVGEQISIWLDGECLMSPNVVQQISGGEAVITRPETDLDSASVLAAQLNGGMLPFELKIA